MPVILAWGCPHSPTTSPECSHPRQTLAMKIPEPWSTGACSLFGGSRGPPGVDNEGTCNRCCSECQASQGEQQTRNRKTRVEREGEGGLSGGRFLIQAFQWVGLSSERDLGRDHPRAQWSQAYIPDQTIKCNWNVCMKLKVWTVSDILFNIFLNWLILCLSFHSFWLTLLKFRWIFLLFFSFHLPWGSCNWWGWKRQL